MHLSRFSRVSSQTGFTLIEVLLAVGIVIVMGMIAMVAIDPTRQLAETNNAKRRADLNTLLSAIHYYQADHGGKLPTSIATISATISNGGADLCPVLVSTYSGQIPTDPKVGTFKSCAEYNSGYTIVKSLINDHITLSAPHAELDEVISVSQ